MAATQIVERIGKDRRRIGAPLWEVGRAAEIERETVDDDLWESDGVSDPVVDSQIRRIDLNIRPEIDADPIESETRFIDQIRVEDVRLIEGEDLTASPACVAEAGNRGSLDRGLDAQI